MDLLLPVHVDLLLLTLEAYMFCSLPRAVKIKSPQKTIAKIRIPQFRTSLKYTCRARKNESKRRPSLRQKCQTAKKAFKRNNSSVAFAQAPQHIPLPPSSWRKRGIPKSNHVESRHRFRQRPRDWVSPYLGRDAVAIAAGRRRSPVHHPDVGNAPATAAIQK